MRCRRLSILEKPKIDKRGCPDLKRGKASSSQGGGGGVGTGKPEFQRFEALKRLLRTSLQDCRSLFGNEKDRGRTCLN